MKNKRRPIITIQRTDALAMCSREAGHDSRSVFARLPTKMPIQIETLFHWLSRVRMVTSQSALGAKTNYEAAGQSWQSFRSAAQRFLSIKRTAVEDRSRFLCGALFPESRLF